VTDRERVVQRHFAHVEVAKGGVMEANAPMLDMQHFNDHDRACVVSDEIVTSLYVPV